MIEHRDGISHPVGVSKSALGRGLGNLLEDAKAAGRSATAGVPTATENEPQVDPGLSVLLQGAPSNGPAAAKATTATRPDAASRTANHTLLRWSLVGADVVVCALVLLFAAAKPGRLSTAELLLCLLAMGVGAWLSCVAVMLGERSDSCR
ncbi:MAG: hypothetical protein HYY24_11740 [Verrucomicrobia bacterium]|nr:hypothetical protein [Verrucomicrobiota bacterium]